jgi:hypothetical protein
MFYIINLATSLVLDVALSVGWWTSGKCYNGIYNTYSYFYPIEQIEDKKEDTFVILTQQEYEELLKNAEFKELLESIKENKSPKDSLSENNLSDINDQ